MDSITTSAPNLPQSMLAGSRSGLVQVVGGDVSAQTERVLQNLAAIFAASGSGLEKVLRCTVFLKNMGDFAAMNEVYGRYFLSRRRRRGRRLRWRGFRRTCWWRLMRLLWGDGGGIALPANA